MIKFENDKITRSQLVAVISEYVVGRNAERNRALLTRYYTDGISYERLAEEFQLSPRQVGNIVRKHEWVLLKL